MRHLRYLDNHMEKKFKNLIKRMNKTILFLFICAIYIPLLKFKLLFKYGITSLSYAYIPSVACSNVPVLTKLSIIGFTTFIGIAKPIPSADVIFTVFIPYYFSIWIY